MNKNQKKLILLLSILIFLSFFILAILDYTNYRDIIEDDILNITKLISTNIYSEIQIEIVKPIYVSLTMANNSFVKDWIADNEQNPEVIQQYLKGIKDKYNYNSSFLISNITNNYYHHTQILKKISPNDSHDIWYYDFLEKNVKYDLDVDTDEASANELTLFVNCTITDDANNVIGVTGVGMKMARIRNILEQYNQNLEVEVSLIDPNGDIQIHADENIIEKVNIFERESITPFKDQILSEKNELKIFKLGGKYDSNYLITYYIEELDWYLIVQKDTLILKNILKSQMLKELIIFLIAFIIVSFSVIKIIKHYQIKTIKLANTDLLTAVNNRNAFDEQLIKAINYCKKTNNVITLAIIDIDDFKIINDTYGHIYGDDVLKTVAYYLKNFIRSDDIIARWGGDEFAIIFNCNMEIVDKIIQRIKESNINDAFNEMNNISISIGMTQYKNKDTVDSILKRADKALYKAKENGKDQICKI